MSDKDIVLSTAHDLGEQTPVVLRWEGAGNSTHVSDILEYICQKTYKNSQTIIKYDAYVNLYESVNSNVGKDASNTLQPYHWLEYGQSVTLTYDVNLMRASHAFKQPTAHVMFVRNIMTTDATKTESQTRDTSGLQTLHTTALRNRANSLTTGGSLRLGMSGAPGIRDASGSDRRTMPVNQLFQGFDALVGSAEQGGLQLSGTGQRLAGTDAESGSIMVNKGANKTGETYYLTFQRPVAPL